MRLLPLVLILGCAADGDALDDYTDEAWGDAEDPGIAELEDASTLEEPGEPPDELDLDAAPEELDDVDDPAADARAVSYRNPIAPGCADPGVIRVAGPMFYAACTGNGYPLFKSRDLVHWSKAGHIFTTATKPKWAGGNFWAPEIHHIGAGFVAYFSALSPQRGKMCIGAARATSMAGPWRDLGHPLVCDKHVSLIDAHVMTVGDRHFLYYKTDGNGLRPQEKTIIYGHELRADGAGFVGKRHQLIKNTLAWEGDVVEGAWVKKRGGFYYLFYSGFRYCNATYGVGVARSRSPLGPFRKHGAPILHSNAAWSGPGHNSIVASGGRDYIVYHAWSGAHDCGDPGQRKLMLDRVTWSGGWPSINSGSPGRGAQPVPVVP